MFTTTTTTLLLALTALSTALPQGYATEPAANSDFVCPAADMIATRCMGPKDCLYPLAGNCNAFIQCQPADETYTTGIVYHMPCPAGLFWNDNEKWCDYEENSTCPSLQ